MAGPIKTGNPKSIYRPQLVNVPVSSAESKSKIEKSKYVLLTLLQEIAKAQREKMKLPR